MNGVGERIREGHELWHEMQKSGVLEQTLILFWQMDDYLASRARALRQEEITEEIEMLLLGGGAFDAEGQPC